MHKTVRIVELKVGSLERVLYETTDRSREAHAQEQLGAVRHGIIQEAVRRIYKRIERGITKYMPGDCPCSESWDVRDYVSFEFRGETEYLTDETNAAIDRFVSEMISRSNSINRGDYNAYNTPEKIKERARHAEMVNHNLAVHRYEVERHAGRTTAQQKEHERTRDCPW